MAYCTATEAKDGTLTNAVSQSGWTDTNVGYRIAEADAVIDGKLAKAGYAVPFTTVPALVKQLSILYTRYAVVRDIYKNSAPSDGGAAGFQPYKDQFDMLMGQIIDGEMSLIGTTGEIAKAAGGVQISTGDVKRALTMGEPEDQGDSIDASYTDPSVTGDPS